ncbi:MAG: hypothetical protein ACRDYA_05130 [Egibacteraceae bacterium]
MLYDDVSFTFMTPEGRGLACGITFSASELGLALYVHQWEDLLWQHTPTALSAHFGVHGQIDTEVVCVDLNAGTQNTTAPASPGEALRAGRAAHWLSSSGPQRREAGCRRGRTPQVLPRGSRGQRNHRKPVDA